MKMLLLILLMGFTWIGFAVFLIKVINKDSVVAATKSPSQKKCPPHSWSYFTIRGVEGMNCTVCGFRAGTYSEIENNEDI